MKIIKILVALIVTLALLATAGAYYSGQQIAKLLPQQVEQINAQLAQSRLADSLSLAVELDSLQTGLFSSQATYSLVANDQTKNWFDNEFKLHIITDMQHGPLPLSRLIRGKLMPVMHTGSIRLEEPYQSAIAKAWLDRSGEKDSPLTLNYLANYSGDVFGSFNFAAFKQADAKVDIDMAAWSIDFAITEKMTKQSISSKLPPFTIVKNALTDNISINSVAALAQSQQLSEGESIVDMGAIEFSFSRQNGEHNLQAQIPKILFTKGGAFADESAQMSNVLFTSQANASQQLADVLLQKMQISFGKMVFDIDGNKVELQEFVFKSGVEEDGPNIVAKGSYGLKQILFKKQPLLGFNLEISLQDIPLRLYQQFQTMLVAVFQHKEVDDQQWLQLLDQILLEQPQIRYDLGISSANATATANASLILQQPLEFSFANQDALAQVKDPEQFIKGLAVAVEVPTQVIKDFINVSLSLQPKKDAANVDLLLPNNPIGELMFAEGMNKLKEVPHLQPFLKITDDSISLQISYSDSGDVVINGVEYAKDSEELRQLFKMATD